MQPLPEDAERSKARLLQTLKRLHTATAQTLAQELQLTVPAVRRHLQDLHAQGLLRQQREKPQGRGRPQHVYCLSEAGEATFPKGYDLLCSDILRHLRELYGAGALLAVLDARRAQLCREFDGCKRARGKAERASKLAQHLNQMGYAACVEGEGEQLYLVEYNCPYAAVAREYPEVCRSELELYQDLLDCSLTRETHIVSGAGQCRYRLERT